jgi:hypothetical protein
MAKHQTPILARLLEQPACTLQIQDVRKLFLLLSLVYLSVSLCRDSFLLQIHFIKLSIVLDCKTIMNILQEKIAGK